MENDEIVKLYWSLDVDVWDLETNGWKGCDGCPRKSKVISSKQECQFDDCLTNFVETGHSIDLRKLEVIGEDF
jgi:hypothetical protein